MVILLLTGLPGSLLPKTKPVFGIDKIAHLLMYAGFAFVTLWGYRKPYREHGNPYRNRACLLTLAISVVFGALTEVMQETCIPGRIGSVFDWLADVAGSILGTLLFYFLYRNRNKIKNESFINK